MGRLWIVWLLALMSLGASGPDLADMKPALAWFSERTVLSNSAITALAQDAEGGVWVGTQSGLMRTRGGVWENVPLPEPNISPFVRCIRPDAGGTVWVGMIGNGLHRWHQGVWESFSPRRRAFPSTISSILPVRGAPGSVWLAGGTEGLWRLDGSNARRIASAPSLVRTLAELPSGELLLGTNLGVYRGDGASWSLWAVPRPDPLDVYSLRVDPTSSAVWVGATDGLHLLQPQLWRPFTEPGSPRHTVFDVATLQHHPQRTSLWVATEGGLFVLSGTRWSRWGLDHGLQSHSVRALLPHASPGSPPMLWVGTFNGLGRLAFGRWRTPLGQNHLANPIGCSLVEDDTGSIWLGHLGGGLSRVVGNHLEGVTQIKGVPLRTVTTMIQGRDLEGRLRVFAGVEQQGLLMGSQGNWSFLPCPDAFRQLGPTAIHSIQAPDGSWMLWIGTNRGVWRYDRSGFAPIQPLDGLRVMSILETRDPQGQSILWVATQGRGLLRYQNGQCHPEPGIPSGSVSVLRLLPLNGKPTLWAGTLGAGIFVRSLADPKAEWTPYPAALPGFNVAGMLQDRRGRLYCFTDRGVHRINDPTIPDQGMTFGSGDGLPGLNSFTGTPMMDRQGRIWTSTTSGLTCFDPEEEVLTPGPLQLQIHAITSGGRPIASGTELSHRQNQLAVQFGLSSHFREEDHQFRIQLIGLDPAPGPWKKGVRQEYPSLPPGTYTLQIQGKDALGQITPLESVVITIRPAPWKHPLALLGYALLLALLGWLVSHARLRMVTRQNQRLEARVRARTQELDGANRELRLLNEQKNQFLRVVSHDLRNPLSGILLTTQLLVEEEPHPERQELLQRILSVGQSMTDLMHRFLDVGRIEQGQVLPECESILVPDLLQDRLQRWRPTAQAKQQILEVQAGATPVIWADPRYTREILDNLISNALKYAPRNTQVTLLSGTADLGPWMAVQDQGPGIAPEEMARLFQPYTTLAARPTGDESSVGLGLYIAQQFAQSMGGRIDVASTPGQGSCFRLWLPAMRFEDPPGA